METEKGQRGCDGVLTIIYEFTVGKHVKQAHEYTDVLIEEAYRRKDEGNPTSSDERVTKSDALCESCFDQVGVYPPPNVLTRLAWYVVFDEMTDMHPDKMTREEYPIMSDSQTIERRKKHITVEDMEYGDRTGLGRRKGHFIGGDGYVGVSNHKIPEAESHEIMTAIEHIDVMSLLNDANLTKRQRQAIDLVYFEDMTQEDAGEVMGVTRQAVDLYARNAINKIRRLANE